MPDNISQVLQLKKQFTKKYAIFADFYFEGASRENNEANYFKFSTNLDSLVSRKVDPKSFQISEKKIFEIFQEKNNKLERIGQIKPFNFYEI